MIRHRYPIKMHDLYAGLLIFLFFSRETLSKQAGGANKPASNKADPSVSKRGTTTASKGSQTDQLQTDKKEAKRKPKKKENGPESVRSRDYT